ncbi:MAG: hypothetical protein OHK93_007506 [Ramalina farinacea]|uniref:DUF7707 domain-containing protein n=1 Tax=Ramalina farinacea TaxID=258253 RepID=A0AA43QKM1_9LECA|nr:hypothetical protein [Ramalina farinacea]
MPSKCQNLLTDTTPPTNQSTLSYSCICSNGLQPNSSQYSQTIPYYECTTAATDCVNKCEQTDSSCQSACRTDNKCGAQNPTRVNLTTSSASASGASQTGGSASSGTAAAGADGASATDTSDASRVARGFVWGFGSMGGSLAVLVGLTGGFMIFL